MDIQLHGKRTSVATGATINDLVRTKDLDATSVVVEHNLMIVTAADWGQITLQENDTLEILRFVGGG